MRGVAGTAGSNWSAKDLRDMASGKYNPWGLTGKKHAQFKKHAKAGLKERGLGMKPKHKRRRTSGFFPLWA